MKKVISGVILLSTALLFLLTPFQSLSANENEPPDNSVRFPSPELCPNEGVYRTNCVGNGWGCDMTVCDDFENE